jgi:hypothetical protein
VPFRYASSQDPIRVSRLLQTNGKVSQENKEIKVSKKVQYYARSIAKASTSTLNGRTSSPGGKSAE